MTGLDNESKDEEVVDTRDDIPEFTERSEADMPILSASSIKSYKTCPRQYYFNKVADVDGTQVSPKRYRHLGSAVHEAIETVLEEHGYDSDTIVADLQREYEQTPYIDAMSQEMVGKGKNYLETAGRYLMKNQYEIKDIEVPKEIPITIGDQETRIRGIIDVATPEYIIDWKTGTIRDDTPEEEMIQGSTYVKLFEELYSYRPEGVKFVYLKEQTEREIDADPEHWDFTETWAQKLLKAVEEEDFAGKPWDAPCFFCDFHPYCPDHKTGYGNINWEDF